MIMRRPVRRDDEVAVLHLGLLALDRRVGSLALEDKTDGGSHVLMRVGNLARQDQLDAGKERIGDARLARLAGIFQHEHAALGLLGGDDIAGLEHQFLDLGKLPQRRLHLGLRLGCHQALEHLPQGREVVL